MYRNICLIGLPHAGKTTIGKQLIPKLKKGFIDTDDIIRAKYDCPLSSLIERCGNQEFLKIERDVVQSLICENTIISTGGSVIYHKSTMEHLKINLDSKIIHLKLNKLDFLQKATDLKRRGVVLEEGQSLDDFYESRIKLYDQYADYSISPSVIDLKIFK